MTHLLDDDAQQDSYQVERRSVRPYAPSYSADHSRRAILAHLVRSLHPMILDLGACHCGRRFRSCFEACYRMAEQRRWLASHLWRALAIVHLTERRSCHIDPSGRILPS